MAVQILKNSFNSLVSILLFTAMATGLSSCQINSPREELKSTDAADNKAQLPEPGKIDPKYSVAADRKRFEELRSEVSETKKVQNDERALFSEWMAEVTTEPSAVREKFDSVVRRKREEFNKDISQVREKYGREEKKSRDVFTKELEAEREELKGTVLNREDRQTKFSEIEQKRRDYYTNEREQRDQFEAEIRTSRKDFEDYMKRRTDEFNAEYKIYLIKWKENQNRTK